VEWSAKIMLCFLAISRSERRATLLSTLSTCQYTCYFSYLYRSERHESDTLVCDNLVCNFMIQIRWGLSIIYQPKMFRMSKIINNLVWFDTSRYHKECQLVFYGTLEQISKFYGLYCSAHRSHKNLRFVI